MNKVILDVNKFVEAIVVAQQKSRRALANDLTPNYDDSTILSFFSSVEVDSLYANSAIANKVADYLQLLKEKVNFAGVSLEEIKTIYKILIELHPFDISLYESLGWYLHNVLDCEEEAKEVVNKGIDIIQCKIDKLRTQFS